MDRGKTSHDINVPYTTIQCIASIRNYAEDDIKWHHIIVTLSYDINVYIDIDMIDLML